MSDQTLFLDTCRALLGDTYVLTTDADMAPFLTDWRDRFTGKALAVLRPASTEQVAAVLHACTEWNVPVVPQGGNTGLVLGSIPDAAGTAVVLSLARLNRIRALDPVNRTITVDAGCILQTIQEAASAAGCLFPLSLAAEGSCTIGGNLSTNAGGTAVLRYGNTRELCLGLEVVTPQGDIWSGLRGLRKDNTGYDLRDIYIGAEGTLGVITGAVIKLFPKPVGHLTTLTAVSSIENALELLNLARSGCDGATLTAFELISSFCLTLVEKHFPTKKVSLTESPYFVLIEFSVQSTNNTAEHSMNVFMEMAYENGVIEDAIIATSLSESKMLWHLRESISPAQAVEGKNIKHDISIPISQIGNFVRETDAILKAHFPEIRMVTFGHL